MSQDNSDMQKLAQPEKEMLKNLCRAYVSGYAMEGLSDLSNEKKELNGLDGEAHRTIIHRQIMELLDLPKRTSDDATEETLQVQKILHNMHTYCDSFPDVDNMRSMSSIQINKVGKELADILENHIVLVKDE